jgi:mannose-6-phosphate isomerase-like protein (cupin superfamily)
MIRRHFLGIGASLVACIATFKNAEALQTGEPQFRGADPAKYKEFKGAHGGAGILKYQELYGADFFETPVMFIHRGVLMPKSSIGEHVHKDMEEMYFVFNAPAEFTVNGHTALLPAGSNVLCPMGFSHGIYNNSDTPLEWLNIAVGIEKGKGRAIDLGEDLTKQTIESPAPFKWSQFDETLMRPAANAHGGKGSIMFRRLWAEDSFRTPWFFVDHCVLPPDTSIGYHCHDTIEEIYFIKEGTGRMTSNDVTRDVKPGDCIPCTLRDAHGLYNNSNKPLVMFNFSVKARTDQIKEGSEPRKIPFHDYLDKR